MAPPRPLLAVAALLLLCSTITSASPIKNTYIVHMAKAQMPATFTEHTNWYSDSLTAVSPAAEVIYTYNTVAHGFAARLTAAEARTLSHRAGVLAVNKEAIYTLHTTPMAIFPSLLLFLLHLSSAAANRHLHHHIRSTLPAAPPSTQLSQACAATRYPAICSTTLSTSPLPPNPTTLDLIDAALNSSSLSLATAQSNAQAILAASSADPNRTNAAHNCLELLSYSSYRLTSTFTSTTTSLPDARAFAGAALLYQYDCWSALKYVNGTQQVADAMTQLVYLTNLTSNALSMITALQRYGADVSLWGPPQTERDGYWGATGQGGEATGGGSFPTKDAANAEVCLGGSCEFASVQSAVDTAPDYGKGKYVIYIKGGVYEETVRVPFKKTNIVFVGDGMGKTVITGALNVGMIGVSTYNSATVGVSGDGFMARHLTIQNTAGPDAHQAVAFLSDSDLSVLDSVEFSGHQDTLYAHSLRQYYHNCLISGTVDFIFGNSAAVFDSCKILVLPRQLNPDHGEVNTVTAHGRTDPAQPTGFVLNDCVINASAEYSAVRNKKPAVHRSYLGRPWKEYSRTVLVNCYLSEIIQPEGWSVWVGDFALKTLFYGEFGSKGPGANSTARVPWSSQIPAEYVGVYSVENFIQGGQWIPTDM